MLTVFLLGTCFSQTVNDCSVANSLWLALGGSANNQIPAVCCGHDGRVACINSRITAIDYSYQNLQGALPDSVSQLTELQTLTLDRNLISGTIPPSLNTLKNLKAIYLSQNSLTGTIPDLSGLKQLQNLYLTLT